LAASCWCRLAASRSSACDGRKRAAERMRHSAADSQSVAAAQRLPHLPQRGCEVLLDVIISGCESAFAPAFMTWLVYIKLKRLLHVFDTNSAIPSNGVANRTPSAENVTACFGRVRWAR
jgi:hypothetical protein